MDFRKNSVFPKRLAERARHTLKDWEDFEEIHKEQFEFFKKNSSFLNLFIYKYFIYPP
jgi:hypothetical protein